MKRTTAITVSLLSILCVACGPKNKQNSIDLQAITASVSATDSIYPVYAQGFEVKYLPNHVRLVDLRDPQNESSNTFHYALVPRGTKPERIPSDYTVIETPVRSVICMTSLQLSNFIKLEACDKVVGITSTRHLFNKEMNERLKSGKTAKIGIEGNFDNEVIMSVNPDVIFISPFKRGGYDTMREIGILLVPHLGYKEMTPLGQAEWIKFIGLFIGQEEEANEKFAAIEKHYNDLKQLAADVKELECLVCRTCQNTGYECVFQLDLCIRHKDVQCCKHEPGQHEGDEAHHKLADGSQQGKVFEVLHHRTHEDGKTTGHHQQNGHQQKHREVIRYFAVHAARLFHLPDAVEGDFHIVD